MPEITDGLRSISECPKFLVDHPWLDGVAEYFRLETETGHPDITGIDIWTFHSGVIVKFYRSNRRDVKPYFELFLNGTSVNTRPTRDDVEDLLKVAKKQIKENT